MSPGAEELTLRDVGLLRSLNAVVERRGVIVMTRAGLLLFGKTSALRRLCPSARIDYILVDGPTWVADPAGRYQTVEIRNPLMLAVPKIIELVLQDLPKAFTLKGRRNRRDEVPAIPRAVIREAVVNAVMHRTYRQHQPIQIIKFSDRIEFRNPGYSLISAEKLGEPGSQTRNPTIAAVLHETGYAETKGTGIKVMREQMHSANMTEPIFNSNRDLDSFEVSLLTHHLLDADTINWLSQFSLWNLNQDDAKALVFIRKRGFVDNATYRALNGVDVLAASLALRRLRDLGLLKSHGKSTATYYTLREPARLGDATSLSTGLNALDSDSPVKLSAELVGLLRKVGERAADPDLVETAIVRLCAEGPKTLSQLSRFVGREAEYLRRRFLGKLIKTGIVQYRYPNARAHPQQAYVAAPWLKDAPIPADRPKRRTNRSVESTTDEKEPKLPF
jgi:ATP-dependent DNA helicase RecG